MAETVIKIRYLDIGPEYSKEQIEKVLYPKDKSVLLNDDGKKLFRMFVMKSEPKRTPDVIEFLDLHELCQDMLGKPTESKYEEIKDKCSNLNVKVDLKSNLDKKECMEAIQAECFKLIEADPLYFNFKKDLTDFYEKF